MMNELCFVEVETGKKGYAPQKAESLIQSWYSALQRVEVPILCQWYIALWRLIVLAGGYCHSRSHCSAKAETPVRHQLDSDTEVLVVIKVRFERWLWSLALRTRCNNYFR